MQEPLKRESLLMFISSTFASNVFRNGGGGSGGEGGEVLLISGGLCHLTGGIHWRRETGGGARAKLALELTWESAGLVLSLCH